MHTQPHDLTLLRNAINMRAGYNVIVDSAAWHREIMLLNEHLICAVTYMDASTINEFGGSLFLEEFATEYFRICQDE